MRVDFKKKLQTATNGTEHTVTTDTGEVLTAN